MSIHILQDLSEHVLTITLSRAAFAEHRAPDFTRSAP